MKKFMMSFFMFALILIVIGGVTGPRKPIEAKQYYASAEEIVEYTDEENSWENDVSICVIGNASKSISPDKACITAKIETVNIDLNKSKDENFDLFEKAISALEGVGITRENISLESFMTYPNYDYCSSRQLTGYVSCTMFSFCLDNLDNVKSAIDAISENGSTTISDIRYEVSNLDEQYSEVMLLALDNAKMKASKLLGREELTVKNIREESVYYSNNLYRTCEGGADYSMLTGKIEVKSRVIVDFI